MLCKILVVSTSSYYDWKQTPISKWQKKTMELDKMIKSIFYEHKERYGSTRIFVELKSRNIKCTRARVSERMKIMNLTAKARKKFKATTDSNHNKAIAANLLNQNFIATVSNKKWLTDITYIRTNEGWLYLCVFIDLYSRAVIGWSMDKRMTAALVTNALTMALFRRKFPRNVIIHSDRGTQYCANSYQSLLLNNRLICSMSGKGCCYDNAAMESFFHSLKVELVHDEQYKTREEAKTSIVEYMECYYNKKRRHSAISYLTPERWDAMEITG